MVIDFFTLKEVKTTQIIQNKKIKIVNSNIYKSIKEIEEIIKQKRNLQALYRRNELVVINGYIHGK